MDTQQKQTGVTGQPAPTQARPFQVRSDVRAGASAECSRGLQYWKSEYQRLKQMATAMGCI